MSRTREHRNFGGSPALCITARPRLAGDVTLARLQLYAATTSQAGYAVRGRGRGLVRRHDHRFHGSGARTGRRHLRSVAHYT